jgi:nitroreductase
MHVDDAIRSRRTLKEFEDREVPAGVVRELLELAVLAPNHHLTLPWRFWVLGPETLEQLIRATGDVKLRRSRTAIAAGIVWSEDGKEAQEDYAATACALQNVMLAARARGLASYWRTPGVFAKPAFGQILGVPENVRLVGLVHLGWPAVDFPEAPPRSAEGVTQWLP